VNVIRPGAWRRWVAVAVVVGVLVALPVVRAAWPVGSTRVDPAVLRERILASAGVPYQGYVDSQGQVALPGLPQLGDVSGLFGGSTSVRVWHASAQSWRVAVVDPAGERDIYRTETGAFVWDFSRNLSTEIVGDLPVRLPWAPDVLPPDLARRLLAAVAPGDQLVALPPQRVAGITAAGLRFAPSDPDTTISHLDVWADPANGLPLRIDVAGVFSSRFLDLLDGAPPPSVLTPQIASSSGFTSTSQPDVISTLNAVAAANLPRSLAGRPRVEAPVSAVAAYGAGLSRFMVIPVPRQMGPQTINAVRDAGGASVPGGYVVRSAVLTVLVARPTGRRTYLLAGFVTPDLLSRAAAELR
jgi:hypothetical protein